MGEIGKLRGLVPSALLQSPRRLDEARGVFVDVLGMIMVLKAGKPGTDSAAAPWLGCIVMNIACPFSSSENSPSLSEIRPRSSKFS